MALVSNVCDNFINDLEKYGFNEAMWGLCRAGWVAVPAANYQWPSVTVERCHEAGSHVDGDFLHCSLELPSW